MEVQRIALLVERLEAGPGVEHKLQTAWVRHASSRLGKGCPELQPSMQQSATSVLPVMPVRCLSCRVGPINGRASLSGKSFSYESVLQEDCGCISATNIGIRTAPKPAAQQLLTKACGATISHVLGLQQKSEIRRPTKSLAVKLGGRKVVRSHHPIQKLWRTRTFFTTQWWDCRVSGKSGANQEFQADLEAALRPSFGTACWVMILG